MVKFSQPLLFICDMIDRQLVRPYNPCEYGLIPGAATLSIRMRKGEWETMAKSHEEVLVQVAEYKQNHAEQVTECNRLYRQIHLFELEAKNLLWWQSPKGRAYKRKRRHENRARGRLDLIAFYAKCAELGWHCCICGKELTQEMTTIDHIIPIKKGGTNDIENLQPLCGRCNCRKSTHSMKEMLGPEFLF